MSEFGVPGHFLALAIRHAFTSCPRHAIERRAEPFGRRYRRSVIHFHRHRIVTGSLNECPVCRCIVLPLDQVALPISRHQTVVNLRRAQVDTDVLNLVTTINAPSVRSTCALTLLQTLFQFLAQRPCGHRIDRFIDDFPASVGFFEIDFHDVQLVRDLLWEKAVSKQVKHKFEAIIAQNQLSDWATNFTVLASVSLCDAGRVSPTEGSIAIPLAANRRGASAKHSSHLALTKILILPELDRGALFDAEPCIGHDCTLLEGEVLNSAFAATHLKTYRFYKHSTYPLNEYPS